MTPANGDMLVAWGGKLAYHPQTALNGLAECFNRTLTDMLAKKVEQNRNAHLSFVLFA